MQRGARDLLFVSAIIAIVVAINFLTMPAEEYPGDANAVRAEAITLLNTGKWAIPAEIAEDYGPRGQYFYQNASGHWYPKYGVLNALIYVPPLWLRKIVTGNLEDSPENTLFLNLLNIAFSGATALYLILLARRYTRSTTIIWIFVLASLYSTFWWNYLRTQTFEIYHTLFLLAFFYHFVVALDVSRAKDEKHRGNNQFLIAAIYFGALCLCKTVYVVLLPAIVAALFANNFSVVLDPHRALRGRLSLRERIEVRAQLFFFWLPVAIFLCVLAASNWYKFDSPFATGYTQWETERQLFKSSNIFPALWEYLFSPHVSVFLHFPPLLFALAAWPNFARKHRLDAIAAALFAVSLLLVSSMFVNWSGQSSYGPRYLLPILPLISLPFLFYLEWLASLSNRIAKSLLVAGTALVLAYSTLLQISVNSLPFFFCYDLQDLLDNKLDSKPAQYLGSHHFGTINRDFLLYRFGHASPFANVFIRHLNPGESVRMSELNNGVQSNYYWFPKLFGKTD